jgi:hypothetical protein
LHNDEVLRLAFLLMEAAASGFLAPALLERMDRGFDRSLLAARWSAAFVEAICQGPGPTRCQHIGEHNSSYNAAFADHVVDLLKSYSRLLEQKVGHFPILFGLSSHGGALREKTLQRRVHITWWGHQVFRLIPLLQVCPKLPRFPAGLELVLDFFERGDAI